MRRAEGFTFCPICGAHFQVPTLVCVLCGYEEPLDDNGVTELRDVITVADIINEYGG